MPDYPMGTQLISNIHRVDPTRSTLMDNNLESIFQVQKTISARIAYLIKAFSLAISGLDNNMLSQLRRCFQLCSLLVKPSNQQQQCQLFPFLAYLLRKSHLIPNQQDVQSTSQSADQNSQNSNFLNFLSNSAITPHQLSFLKSNRANAFFTELTMNEQILQSSQCVCCSQVFIQDMPIRNSNPLIPLLIDVSKKKAFESGGLARYLNAVCNWGGGVVLIGGRREGNQLVGEGIRFTSEEQMKEKFREIQKVIEKMQGGHTYAFEKVVVHSKFLSTDSQEISKEFLCYCFRILVFQNEMNKLKYVPCVRKGDAPIYDFYYFSGEKEKLTLQSIPKQKLYQQIHLKYYSKQARNKYQNSHQNMLCLSPYPYYSKNFGYYYSFGLLDLSVPPEQEKQEEEQQVKKPQKEEKTQYKDKSLLIVSSYAQDKMINRFLQFLDESKESYDIIRPFRDQFTECVRSVWVLSHQMTHNKMKSLLKVFTNRCQKSEAIIGMPVSPTLEIQNSKFTQYVSNTLTSKLRKQFSKKYPKKSKYQKDSWWVEKSRVGGIKDTNFVSLNFLNQQLAIFAYMTFEEMNLRPYFLSQTDYLAYY